MSSRTKRVKKRLERDRKAARMRKGKAPIARKGGRPNRARPPVLEAIGTGEKIQCPACNRTLNNPAYALQQLGGSDGTNNAGARCPCGQRLNVKF